MADTQKQDETKGQDGKKRIIFNKSLKRIIILAFIAIAIFIVIVAGYWFILRERARENRDDKKNAPGSINNYTNDTNISENGDINLRLSPAELWEELKKNGNDITKYLNSAEELAKLINIQIAGELLYTGEDPEHAVINTETFAKNKDSKTAQGIIKLKREYAIDNNDPKSIYMTYVSPERFQQLIDNYNNAANQNQRRAALLEAMTHFTLVRRTQSNTSASNISMPTSLNGMLFLGDSILGRLKSELESGGATVLYKSSSKPEYFLGEQQLSTDGSCTPQNGTFDWNANLSSVSNPTAVYLILGQNSCGSANRLTKMIKLVEKLQEKYPNAPIYINSVVPAGSSWENNESYNPSAISMNDELKDYCDSVADVYYSDVLEGYSDNVNSLTVDGLHPNGEGVRKLVNNIKNNLQSLSSANSNNNNINNSNNVSDISGKLHWPVPSSTNIISAYGIRNSDKDIYHGGMHTGIDIGATAGEKVEATDSGVVTTAEFHNFNGNYVIIEHENGDRSVYCHLTDYVVNAGDTVNRGQLIGHIGNTGSAQNTVPHLHFEITPSGGQLWNDYVDPMSFEYEYNDYGEGGIGTSITGTTTKYIAKVAKVSSTLDKRESNDPKIKSYENGSSVMTSQEVDYRSYTDKYVMPFNYLWTLLVLSNDKDYVFDLADLVYTSKIELTIKDNKSVTTNIKTSTYQRKYDYTVDLVHVKVEYTDVSENTGDMDDDYPGSSNGTRKSDIISPPGRFTGSHTNPADGYYSVVDTTVFENDNLDISITLADSWCARTEENFEYYHNVTDNTNGPISEPDEDNGYSEYIATDPERAAHNYAQGRKMVYESHGYKDVETSVLSSRTQYHYLTVNKNKTIRDILEENRYISELPVTTDKSDKNSSTPNFVTIYLKHSKARNALYDEWLFDLLSLNDDTKDLVDLTKYYLYKATGKDYGVTDFNTIWEKLYKDYESTLGGTSGIPGNVGIIFDFLLSKGVSPQGCAGVIGNWMQESGCMPNNLENGANTRSGLSDEEFTLQVNNGTISRNEFISSSRFKASESYGSNIYGYGLAQWTSQGRKANLYDFAKSYTGYSNGFDISDINMQLEFFWKELQGYPKALNAIVNATDVATATHVFHREYEVSADPASTTRINYAEDVYKQYLANHKVSGGKIVQKAIEVHRYLRENGYKYGNNTYVPNKTSKYVDCTSYITWVLIEAGVDGLKAGQHQETTDTFIKNRWGWKEIYPKSVNDLKPGDIIIYTKANGVSYDHGEIYAGAGRVFNCGANEAIAFVGTSDYPETQYKLTHEISNITKVLRIEL